MLFVFALCLCVNCIITGGVVGGRNGRGAIDTG